jgi:hypothetical protein
MSTRTSILKVVRVTHLYLGVFIAPALLFFALTGGLQTFSLHESSKGSSYTPPRWAVVLGQLHKKQTVVTPERRGPGLGAVSSGAGAGRPGGQGGERPGSAKPNGQRPGGPDEDRGGGEPRFPQTLPMKIFFLVVAVGLFVSTLTGLYMAYSYMRNKVLVTAALVAGVMAPVVMLLVA